MSLRNHLKSTVIAVAITASLGIGTAGTAIAASHGASTTGSLAWSSSTSIIKNKDTAADGDWSRSNWNSASGSGGISNQSGYNATVQRNTGKDITAVQACRSRNALPMVCSGWNNDY
jgi:hypothetical protein